MTKALFKKQMMEVFSWVYQNKKAGKNRSAKGVAGPDASSSTTDDAASLPTDELPQLVFDSGEHKRYYYVERNGELLICVW